MASFPAISRVLVDGSVVPDLDHQRDVQQLARAMFGRMAGEGDTTTIARIAKLRFWILQEIALAKRLVLRMGDVRFS